MSAALADAVGTLRIRVPIDDPATRTRWGDAVRRVQLPKRGSNPNAVLILRSTQVALAANADRAAVAAELSRRVEAGWRTARPAGPAALGADAVEFRDLSHLLALYVADLVSGRVRGLWWWSAVSRLIAGAGEPGAVLFAHVELVPHVVAELRAAGQLSEVIGELDQGICEDLVRRLSVTFAAPRLAVAVEEVRRALAGSAPTTSWHARSSAAGGTVLPSPIDATSVDVRTVGLAVAMRRLLVEVAERLAVDPLEARSGRFARDAALSALGSREPPVHQPTAIGRSSGVGTAEPNGRVERGIDRAVVSVEQERDSTETSPIDRDDDPGAAAPSADRRERRAATLALSEITPDGQDAHGHRPRDSRVPLPSEGRSAVLLGEVAQAHGHDDAPALLTQLGGVFFLIDPVRQLRLPERFGPNGRFADRLGWWGTIELLARRLLPTDPNLADDPIWAVLAELGGRPALVRALSLEPADLTRTGEWDVDAPPADIGSVEASLARMTGAVGRRWVNEVGARLASALASQLRCEPRQLVDGLLLRQASVVYDRTHVDVHLPLASATAAVRRPGFDRDPGWVPELGRVIAFHFDLGKGGG